MKKRKNLTTLGRDFLKCSTISCDGNNLVPTIICISKRGRWFARGAFYRKLNTPPPTGNDPRSGLVKDLAGSVTNGPTVIPYDNTENDIYVYIKKLLIRLGNLSSI